MKRKKGIFRKFVVMSLLLSLALTPMAMATGNTVYAENTEKAKNAKLPNFCLEGIDKATGKRLTKEITLKVKTHPDYAFWGEEEYDIESVNGVFDFSVVEDKGIFTLLRLKENQIINYQILKKTINILIF